MADLISMRADAMDARKRIDSILAVDGELTAEQASDLESADQQLRSLTEQIKQAEVVIADIAEGLAWSEGREEGQEDDQGAQGDAHTRQEEAGPPLFLLLLALHTTARRWYRRSGLLFLQSLRHARRYRCRCRCC